MALHSARSYTVFAVGRDCQDFTSEDGIAWAHCATEEFARVTVRELDRDRVAYPTRLVESATGRVLWRCDDRRVPRR